MHKYITRRCMAKVRCMAKRDPVGNQGPLRLWPSWPRCWDLWKMWSLIGWPYLRNGIAAYGDLEAQYTQHATSVQYTVLQAMNLKDKAVRHPYLANDLYIPTTKLATGSKLEANSLCTKMRLFWSNYLHDIIKATDKFISNGREY